MSVVLLAPQVILYSEGFAGAKDLASKIVSLFTLSKQLLSRQQHYDWGLRALKAALNTGGKLIQVQKLLIWLRRVDLMCRACPSVITSCGNAALLESEFEPSVQSVALPHTCKPCCSVSTRSYTALEWPFLSYLDTFFDVPCPSALR